MDLVKSVTVVAGRVKYYELRHWTELTATTVTRPKVQHERLRPAKYEQVAVVASGYVCSHNVSASSVENDRLSFMFSLGASRRSTNTFASQFRSQYSSASSKAGEERL